MDGGGDGEDGDDKDNTGGDGRVDNDAAGFDAEQYTLVSGRTGNRAGTERVGAGAERVDAETSHPGQKSPRWPMPDFETDEGAEQMPAEVFCGFVLTVFLVVSWLAVLPFISYYFWHLFFFVDISPQIT